MSCHNHLLYSPAVSAAIEMIFISLFKKKKNSSCLQVLLCQLAHTWSWQIVLKNEDSQGLTQQALPHHLSRVFLMGFCKTKCVQHRSQSHDITFKQENNQNCCSQVFSFDNSNMPLFLSLEVFCCLYLSGWQQGRSPWSGPATALREWAMVSHYGKVCGIESGSQGFLSRFYCGSKPTCLIPSVAPASSPLQPARTVIFTQTRAKAKGEDVTKTLEWVLWRAGTASAIIFFCPATHQCFFAAIRVNLNTIVQSEDWPKFCIYLCVLYLNYNFSNCEAEVTSSSNLTAKLYCRLRVSGQLNREQCKRLLLAATAANDND